MKYQRPINSAKLTKDARRILLGDYYKHYEQIAKSNPELLNSKLPREAFSNLLDAIGALILNTSRELAQQPGQVREFLSNNTLPAPLETLLSADFRVFCLALNAVKQWVSAEQAATDRFLLGGKARDELREVSNTCVVTGLSFDDVGCELHHPVRDGRPPIPLSPAAHDEIEGQNSSKVADPTLATLSELRKKNNQSWKQLRRGCLALLDQEVSHSTASVAASAKAFARASAKKTNLSYDELISVLDRFGLGILE